MDRKTEFNFQQVNLQKKKLQLFGSFRDMKEEQSTSCRKLIKILAFLLLLFKQ